MNIRIYLNCLLIIVLTACQVSTPDALVNDLRCEYLTNPLGIENTSPRLSWKMEKNINGAGQSAYQILAASSIALLNEESADFWNTGKFISNQSIHVNYKGQTLDSRQSIFWKVRIWDENDVPSQWSIVASWEMAFLIESDWQAEWIGSPKTTKGKKMNLPSPYFRKKKVLEKEIESARAYVSGLGYYELTINGQKVGDHVLSPNQTNYDIRDTEKWGEARIGFMNTRVLYETFDITNFVKTGANVFGVQTGNGWYIQADRPLDTGLWYDTPKMIAQFEIQYKDGSKEIVASDQSWRTSKSPILYNGLHSGEIYDARLEQPGWNEPGFDASDWDQVLKVREPTGKLISQIAPPDRVTKTIKPISVSEPEKGISRYDMGQMFSGWARIKVSGEKGSKIQLRFIEELGSTYGQTDTYILKGEGIEIWEPRFTWHAFRYVDVVTTSEKIIIETIEGRIVNTDVEEVGSFESSNALLNQILTNYKWTQLGNMHGGIPSDCPHRERRGYTGDGQISARAAIYNYDMSQFYTKWLDDISDAQNHLTGYVPNTTPYQDGGGGTAWGAAYVIIPWNMYLYYGDKHILQKHYKGMKHWIEYMQNSLDENGILVDQGLGEWVPPELVDLPPDFVNTCYYFHCCKLMEKISNVLQQTSDKSYYQNLSEKANTDIHRKYFNSDNNNYSIGRQGANILPLGFGLVGEADKKEVLKNLINNVVEKNRGHFDTGILGTPLLLEVLTELGRIDLAYTIMTQRDFPGFGDMIEQGATTIWETWHGEASHSHPMFGSVCQWFYQHVGGIVPSEKEPGFKHPIIKPFPISRLKFAKTIYNSLYGEILTDWKLENGDFFLKTTIPANTTATVYVLAKNAEAVSESGKSISKNKHVQFIKMKTPFAVFEVQSGTYNFKSKTVEDLLIQPVISAPVITPGDTLSQLGDSVKINISTDIADTEIKFTTNGTEPDHTSSLFVEPFYVYQPTAVRARVMEEGSLPGFEKKIVIGFIDPEKNGLNFNYYEGVWQKLPEFSKLSATKSGVVYTLGLDYINPNKDEFGLVFTGNIKIENEGEYQFYLMSNDGSKLFIDEKLVITHDGLHGAETEKIGKIHLKKGMHPLKLEYFQAGGGLFLKLQYSGSGIERQDIPATILFKK